MTYEQENREDFLRAEALFVQKTMSPNHN